MLNVDAEQRLEIRSVMLWQVVAVSLGGLISELLFSSLASVLFGGLVVVLSTWHVHRSVYSSGGDKMLLLRSAGLRFIVFLLMIVAAVFVLELQALFLIAGMAVAYLAMYVRSLLMIFRQMKGDNVG